MKILKEKTQNDETISINRDILYREACSRAGSPGGIGSYDATNVTLKNLVFQELDGRGDISQGINSDEIKITYPGKHRPDYQ